MTIIIESNAAEVAESMGALGVDLKRSIRDTMNTVQKETLTAFRRPTSTWHHKPTFQSLSEQRGDGFTLVVGTDDKVYNMLDKGTKPHIIRPKGPGYPLAFQWGGKGSFSAKTQPSSLDSWGGSQTGGAKFFMHVHHPGTKARKWSVMIFKTMQARALYLLQDKIAALIQKAMAKHPLRRPPGF